MLPLRNLPQTYRHIQTASEEMGNHLPYEWKQKVFLLEGIQAILVADKIDFKTKTIIRDKKEHYRMIKGLIPQKDIAILTLCYLEHLYT